MLQLHNNYVGLGIGFGGFKGGFAILRTVPLFFYYNYLRPKHGVKEMSIKNYQVNFYSYELFFSTNLCFILIQKPSTII